MQYEEQDIENVARSVLGVAVNHGGYDGHGRGGATIIALSGDLGAGKTTLAKAIASALGVSESLSSPTFVIAKYYPIPEHAAFDRLVHMDAYRMASEDELRAIGWHDTITAPNTLVVIEWPELVAGALPEGSHYFTIRNVEGSDTSRHISYEKK